MQRIKESRSLSFLVVTMVYVAAAAAGTAFFLKLPFEYWLNLLIADIAATVVVFAFSVIFGNASVYDPYWSVQPIVIVTAFALSARLTSARALLIVAIWFWGVRLTANWAYTFGGLNHQDWRYTMLREKTGKFYFAVNFFGIHLFPTLIVYACVLPAVVVFRHETVSNIGSVVFFPMSVGSVVLQTISDTQMHRFRRQKTGGLINDGLWKNSRHPNYLGEILMWWGVALSAVSVMPSYWFLCAGALANTLMFLFVSIPMAERRQGEKPGFAEYKSRTRMLLPVPKAIARDAAAPKRS